MARSTTRRMRGGFVGCLLLGALTACGGDDGDADDDDDDDGGSPIDPVVTETVCLDGAGEPSPDCAIDPSPQACELGDANDCYAVEREEVWADDGENGVCFFLVAKNTCDATLYSITCIEHDEGTSPEWQCWWSTTLPGGMVDVSQCHATGDYKYVASLDGGKLELFNDKCGF